MSKQYLSPKKGQANAEYMFLALLILLLILPVIYFGLQSSYESHRLLRTDNILNDVSSAANDVNQLGKGNKKTVAIQVPPGITGAVVKGNVLSIKTGTRKGIIPLTKETNTQVVGSFSVEQGRHDVPVSVIGPNLVRIGEGLLLLSIQPNCLGITQMPTTVTLTGDEITPNTILLRDGVPYGGETTYINPTTLTFKPKVEEFPPIEGVPYRIALQDGTEQSNALFFYAHPITAQCGEQNDLTLVHLNTKEMHTYLKEVTTQIAKDDGYYQQLSPNELLHITFTNTMKKNDFLELTYQCSEDSTLTLLEEGTITIVGTVSCKKNTWETKRLYLSIPVTQNNVWDLTSPVGVDIDYIKSFIT